MLDLKNPASQWIKPALGTGKISGAIPDHQSSPRLWVALWTLSPVTGRQFPSSHFLTHQNKECMQQAPVFAHHFQSFHNTISLFSFAVMRKANNSSRHFPPYCSCLEMGYKTLPPHHYRSLYKNKIK